MERGRTTQLRVIPVSGQSDPVLRIGRGGMSIAIHSRTDSVICVLGLQWGSGVLLRF